MDTKQSRYEALFRDSSVWRSIFSLALPSLLTIVVMIFYNMADLFFIAQLRDTAKVAAVSIVMPVFSIIMALATMLGAGGSAILANAIGAGDTEKAKNTSSLCFWAAIGIGLAVGILLLMFQTPLLRMLGTKPEMWEDAKRYQSVLALGTAFMLLPSSMGMLIRSEGAVKEGLIGNLTGTFTNILLDPLFILVFRWGTTGAAIATVLGNVVGTAYYLSAPGELLSIAALGLPNAASTVLSGFASTFSNSLLSQHGTDAIAARAAAGKSSMLISMVQMGICMGVQPLLAYCYGAKNLPRLRETLRKLALLTGGIGLGAVAFCFAFRHFLISLFLKEAEVAAMGEQFMLYVMAGAPFLGVVYLCTNFLQSTRKAKSAIVVSLLRQGLLLIPLLYGMHALFGFLGIAAAHMAADIGAALIAAVIFASEYKRVKEELL